MKNCAETWRHI